MLLGMFKGMGIVGVGVPAAGQSCSSTPTISNTTADDYWGAAKEAARIYTGQENLNPTTGTICRVDFYITAVNGSLTGLSWQVEIFLNATEAGGLGTSLGTSTAHAISNTASGWDVTARFTDLSVAVTSGTLIAITLARTDHSYSATNYIDLGASSTAQISGLAAVWNVSKGFEQNFTPGDFSIKVYYMQ
jgi:hypothetical protein